MGIFSSIKDALFGTKTDATAAAATTTTTAKGEPVDVEAVMEAIVKAKGQPSNWRVSIVDLLKALDMDSSLSARKELAKELNYTGTDPDGSAEKNIWLHKAVMKALAENGGKVPKELLK
jgi:hypothetical protein